MTRTVGAATDNASEWGETQSRNRHPMTTQVRAATDDDRHTVTEILAEALPALDGTREAATRPTEENTRDGRHVHVLEDDGEIVAVAVTSRRMDAETGRAWKWWALDALATREDRRGRGHASELLAAVLTAAERNGIVRIHGCCPPGRATWYRQHGFQVQDVDRTILVTARADGKRWELEPGPGEQLFTASIRELKEQRRA